MASLALTVYSASLIPLLSITGFGLTAMISLQKLITPDSLWRERDFLKLFLATTLVVLGSAVSQMALPLTAIQVLHASATEMGILAACYLLPFVTIGLPAGVWIDRASKKKLAALFDLFAAAGLALVPIGAMFDFLSMPLLCVVGFIVSTTEAVGGSAMQVFITHLVGRDRLVLANSKLSAASSVAMVSGPALAAALVAVVGAPMAVTVNACGFLASALLVSRISYREVQQKAVQDSLLGQMREGLQLIWRTPMLRALVLLVATWIIFSDSFKALYVLHAARNLHLGAGEIALINTMGALGGLAGAPLAHFLVGRFGIRNALVCGVAIAAFGLLAYSLPQPGWSAREWLAGLALFVFDCGSAVYVINYLSLRLSVTPDAYLGRMVTSMRFVTILPGPIGAMTLGWLADKQGLPMVFGLMAGSCMLAAILSARYLPANPIRL